MVVDGNGAMLHWKMLVWNVWLCDVQLFSFLSSHTILRRPQLILEDKMSYQYIFAWIVFLFSLMLTKQVSQFVKSGFLNHVA